MNDIASSEKSKGANYIVWFLIIWCVGVFIFVNKDKLFKGEPWITKKATQPLVESRINQEYSKIQETQKQPRKQPVDKFPYKNVSFTEVGFVTAVIGEITNNSNKNYSMANFLLSIYDKGGKLIGTGDIYINNFLTGQTKTFKAATMPITMDASKVSKYKIQFESGIENSD